MYDHFHVLAWIMYDPFQLAPSFSSLTFFPPMSDRLSTRGLETLLSRTCLLNCVVVFCLMTKLVRVVGSLIFLRKSISSLIALEMSSSNKRHDVLQLNSSTSINTRVQPKRWEG